MSQEIVIHIATCPEDRALGQGSGSWVDALIHFLKLSLLQFQGQDPRIEIHEERFKVTSLDNHEVVIPIISPNFIQQEKLLGDLGYLAGKYHTENPDKKAFFKVVKVPVEHNLLPAELKELLAYNFFAFNQDTGLIQEYEQFEMLDSGNAFWATLVDLTYDILESVLPESTRMIDVGKGRYVFLAETTYYLQLQRRVVKRELSRYGYQVLPDTATSNDLEELKEETLEALKRSEFSIHLIGEKRGEALEGIEETLTELQLDLANSHAEGELEQHQKSFNRLVWLPPGLVPDGSRQELFIEELREHADVTQGIEIVQVRLEDFKSMLLRQLALQTKQAASLSKKQQEAESEQKKVYLIADPRDIEKVRPVATWYEQKGLQVLWVGDNPLASHRDKHIEYLNDCDACIVGCYQSSEPWLITKLQDILKSPGLGRKKPLGKNAVLAFSHEQYQRAKNILERYPQYKNISLIDASDKINPIQLGELLPSSEKTTE